MDGKFAAEKKNASRGYLLRALQFETQKELRPFFG
jgi:hypothetical protein